VNYEADQQWFTWHQSAMRRFLFSAPQTASISSSWLPAGPLRQVDLKPSVESALDLYWPHDSSLVAESKPSLEGMNTVFGECSQTVALEGDPWELSTVSTMTQRW
jgi:hypothetical protein